MAKELSDLELVETMDEVERLVNNKVRTPEQDEELERLLSTLPGFIAAGYREADMIQQGVRVE